MTPRFGIPSLLLIGISSFVFIFVSCKKEEMEPVDSAPPNCTVTYFDGAPYATLSEYGFFTGEMKDQEPAEGVIPYKPASSLFTDYALKKRWIWMPEGRSATYDTDGSILDMPVGTALIKNFYYDDMQPSNERKILETRIMIRMENEWIFGEYIWNDEQTEAYLEMDGSYKNISWLDENQNLRTTDYRFPSETECLICHKRNELPIPIGPKPQNLNTDYNYAEGTMNQLEKLVSVGYLEGPLPANIESVVNWEDPTESIDLRTRSYLDMNCAHCHGENSHCDYRPIRLAFSETSDKANMGLCIDPDEFINAALINIIAPANKDRSVMYFRMNTTDEALRMPLLGRSLVHTEAVDLLEQWINENDDCN